jgi:hypothetical protein
MQPMPPKFEPNPSGMMLTRSMMMMMMLIRLIIMVVMVIGGVDVDDE